MATHDHHGTYSSKRSHLYMKEKMMTINHRRDAFTMSRYNNNVDSSHFTKLINYIFFLSITIYTQQLLNYEYKQYQHNYNVLPFIFSLDGSHH